MKALLAVDRFTMENGILRLYYGDGQQLTFRRATPP